MWWISGNEYLHLLTSASPARRYELRVDLADFDDETRFAEYPDFAITSESDNYRLDLGAYRPTGDAGLLIIIYCLCNAVQYTGQVLYSIWRKVRVSV